MKQQIIVFTNKLQYCSTVTLLDDLLTTYPAVGSQNEVDRTGKG